jgi:cytochrome c oxidase subunit 4
MEHHIIPKRTYYMIFAALFVLLILTVLASLIDIGPFNIALAMAIAITKATLIILYFMHVRFSSRLTWVFASAAFLWLVFLLGLTMTDYISRPWIPLPGI